MKTQFNFWKQTDKSCIKISQFNRVSSRSSKLECRPTTLESEELGHPWLTRSSELNQENRLGISHPTKDLRQTQDTLERLCLSKAQGTSGVLTITQE